MPSRGRTLCASDAGGAVEGPGLGWGGERLTRSALSELAVVPSTALITDAIVDHAARRNLFDHGSFGPGRPTKDYMFASLTRAVFPNSNDRALKAYQRRVPKISALEPAMQALSDEALAAKTAEFRDRLAHGAKLDDLLPEAFAVVREASQRVSASAISTSRWSAAWSCTRARSPK